MNISPQEYRRWYRVVVLVDYAGQKLRKNILHVEEGLPEDDAELYLILKDYNKKMLFKDQREVLCPSNEIIDESKFDLSLYMTLITKMLGSRYDGVIRDLRLFRNRLFHQPSKIMNEKDFQREWNSTVTMLEAMAFLEQSHHRNMKHSRQNWVEWKVNLKVGHLYTSQYPKPLKGHVCKKQYGKFLGS